MSELLSRFLLAVGFVDPDCLGQLRRHRRLADEPFRGGLVSGVEDVAAGLPDRVRSAVVDVGR